MLVCKLKKMREEDAIWFAKWEEELPKPEELMPLTQTLITPDLAVAFDISNPTSPNPQKQTNSSAELESSEVNGQGVGGDEAARTLKRPRLVWTPQLHKRFVDAVAHLGIKNAVPKTIMQLMSVDGLTRENVASHLQKYRLYLKRMQGLSNSATNSNVDSAMDNLFASSPVPPHFLHQGREFLAPPLVTTMQPHHQMGVVVQQHYRQNGQHFENPFVSRQSQVQRMGTSVHNGSLYVEDVDSRKVLTLFPTGDD